MIVVRNCFVAKPGSASKLAALIKDAMASSKFAKSRVLTDMTGDFNRVILEHEAADMQEFEANLKHYSTDEAFRAKMKGYADLYVTGYREILTIV
jgi:hypothetical protein